MNNYIATLDFGTQEFRLIVERDREIVSNESVSIPFIYHRINKNGARFELVKRGIKSLITDDAFIIESDKLKSYDLYLKYFRKVYKHLEEKFKFSKIGIVLIVPELYSEIQRFTLKEIAEKTGFKAVTLINFSRVCAESAGINSNSISEIISVGADYVSFSIMKHENGITKPLDLETNAGFGGYYMDKLLLDQLFWDISLHDLNNINKQSEIINHFITKIENYKINVLNNDKAINCNLSGEDGALKDVVMDKSYIMKCLPPFFSKLTEMQSAILERNKDIIINQTLLAGELTKLEEVKKALNLRSEKVIHLDNKDILRDALRIGRDEVLELLKNEISNEVRPETGIESNSAELNSRQFSQNRIDLSADPAGFYVTKLQQLQDLIHNNDFINAENILQEIKRNQFAIESNVFFKAAQFYYGNHDFLNAWAYIRKTIALIRDTEVIRLFENIVFKEVEKLHLQQRQQEIVQLLREARDQNVSALIKDAFTRENQKLHAQNPSQGRGKNIIPPKKKRR